MNKNSLIKFQSNFPKFIFKISEIIIANKMILDYMLIKKSYFEYKIIEIVFKLSIFLIFKKQGKVSLIKNTYFIILKYIKKKNIFPSNYILITFLKNLIYKKYYIYRFYKYDYLINKNILKINFLKNFFLINFNTQKSSNFDINFGLFSYSYNVSKIVFKRI